MSNLLKHQDIYKKEFIKDCKQKFKNKYDYSNVNYINKYKKVLITCNDCKSVLSISPINHKRSNGCKKCLNNERLKINEEKFIEKIKFIYGDKYDYSKIIYKDKGTKVKITCFKHGVFERTPAVLSLNHGCPKCMTNILSKNEILKELNKAHNNKFKYNLENYKNKSSEITLICNKHGQTNKSVSHFLQTKGCVNCSFTNIIRNKNKNLVDYIIDFNLIHNNQYNYSKTIWAGFKNKIKIICPIHNEFEVYPHNHLNGSGCPKCSTKRKIRTLKDLINEFKVKYGNKFKYPNIHNLYTNLQSKIRVTCPIHGERTQTVSLHLASGCRLCSQSQSLTQLLTDFKSIHGDLYNYSKINYMNSNIPIEIICKKHGSFFQQSSNHKMGAGCPNCSFSKNAEISKFPINEWIQQSHLKHKNKYDYKLVHLKYNNAHTKVEIICPIHGKFLQTAKVHKQGSGCPQCGEYGFNNKQPAILYYISIDNGRAYKIGITNRSVKERFPAVDLKKLLLLKSGILMMVKNVINKNKK